ncbi:hypothetical protein BX616_006554 [Lobosporangium transversale]|uniref:N-acetyltransferase domain-containing protein n=1 Tax=Lobosporangium transversale TaxID=64571 RepID=A0A1Y2GSM6_9FUNG|nr:hypothetical protein BCR41DRAFT_350066 [Lobosporangium transversale]KAF9915257.1 hypothetical protein BX616_006554 [Lobosporangium transversale]ORZ21813.1 hypothetical protein BCR41DRAFT_350066 [Lobosporangium transversale]|eukprot:XP_021883064.1 hypothetical protein BCR41DRAFT_350066 [Lobosporangium transversale]
MTVDNTLADPSNGNSGTPSILITVPIRPPVRSAALSNVSTGASSSLTNLADGPVEKVIFRHGKAEDAALMTEMQFSNYILHYRGILPKGFFDSLDPVSMTGYHTKRMAHPVEKREMVYVVAERINPRTNEHEVIGMSQAMAPYWKRAYNHRFYEGWSQNDFDCEIDTLYVKIGVQGGGVGRKLVLGALKEAYERLNMRKGVIIWTLMANTQGRAFYIRIGCEEVAIRTLDLVGVPCECVGYAFRKVGEAIGVE